MTNPLTMPSTTKAWKAYAAFVVSFIATFIGLMQKTDVGMWGTVDWVIAVGTAVVTAAAVWGIPNPPLDTADQD